MRRIFYRTLWAATILSWWITARAQTPTWSQFPNTPGGTLRHDDVIFTDLANGWSARGIDGVYRTTNGGASWVKVIPNLSPVAHFRSIGFASATRGWAGNLGPGSYDAAVTDTNMLYETFDGGVNWSVVPAFNDSGMKGFCAMHVRDAQHIYGVGRVRGPAYFAKSENGGASWAVTNLTAAGVMGGLMDVYFKDALHGFIVGMNTNLFTAPPYYGSIARTTNGGLTWQVQLTTPVTNSYFWKMSWPSAAVGYVSLQQNAAHDTVIFYKTIDGGATWSSNGIPFGAIGAPPSFGLQGIGFLNEMEGWMGGSASTALTHQQNFIHTTNGGLSWAPEGYSNTRSINRIRFVSPTLGYMSGQTLHVYHVPLTVTVAPTNPAVAVGGSVNFAATAYGTAPLTYQWRFNGTNLNGATGAIYALPNVQAAQAGNYSIVVSDFSGAITSAIAVLSVTGLPVAPTITSQPQSLLLYPGSNATFSVGATGTPPLFYQWRFNGTNISAATNGTYTRLNAQLPEAGQYSVRVTNSLGSVTSAEATLSLGFADDFDSYLRPLTVTGVGNTNGYRILFNAAAGGLDFQAVFGFDYSAIVFPTNIGPAPNTIGGTTKGLYLSVNKDGNGQPAAVNLYPLGQNFSGNYALKFDLWLNWATLSISVEHALIGLNHSGQLTNRIGLATSDGLLFSVNADGFVSATTSTLRDFGIYHGGGPNNVPVLLTTNNTVFGPTPPLGGQFDSANPGIASLFPVKTIPGWGASPVGSPGLGWVRGEVRQVHDLITFLLNDTAIAQYTNTYGYTNGTVLIGYSDNFASIGAANNFVIFDNIRVAPIVVGPAQLLTPTLSGNNFSFRFATLPYESYTVQVTTNLAVASWTTVTNFAGNGLTNTITLPWSSGSGNHQYFRVSRP